MHDLSPLVVVGLALVGFAGGVGITAIGPGGILPTIGLVTLTGLAPAEVAGTAIATHVATGALGTATCARSGHLRAPGTARVAWTLGGVALIGTPLGIALNSLLSPRWFGLVLGALLAVVALLVLPRARRTDPPATRRPGLPLLVGIGLFVSVVAGVVGIGGPMLTVPLLVAVGFDMLGSLAAAQAQSVVIAGVGTIGYLLQGSIDWPLAVLVGVPELAGVLLGWRIARAVPTRTLQLALVTALLAMAPYLVWHG